MAVRNGEHNTPNSVIETARRVRANETTPAAETQAALDRLARGNPAINAVVQPLADEARAAAAANKGRGALAGVPIAVKDNICTLAGRTTCASRMLDRYRSPFDAAAVERLIDAGAAIIGKTNLDEFGMGSSTEHSIFGPTRNPWDPSRVAGGSSGGSAAAVAAGIVPVALGSDTGGSVRQPAALCGIVGLKPTYGRVSRFGLVAYASSLDQIGVLTRTVSDAACVLGVIAGPDPRDATCALVPVPDYLDELDRPIEGLRLGVLRSARAAGHHEAVSTALERAIAAYERAGATILDIDLPHADYGIAAYYLVACAEASSNLARYDGVRYGHRCEPTQGETLEDLYLRSRSEGFGREVQRRIMLGTYVLSAGYFDAYYARAMRTRRQIRADFDAAFDQDGPACHAVLMPATPGPAFALGEMLEDPLALYLQDLYTVGVNLAGLPAISLPCGFAQEGASRLPVGVQLVGRAWDEARLLRIARMFEAACPWPLVAETTDRPLASE